MHRPHFLRVVQALSLVSGFGSAAIVAGASLLACSSSSSGGAPPGDAGADAYKGIVTGSAPSCTLDEAGACEITDASVGGGGIQVAPDAEAGLAAVGGPLPPPELPA